MSLCYQPPDHFGRSTHTDWHGPLVSATGLRTRLRPGMTAERIPSIPSPWFRDCAWKSWKTYFLDVSAWKNDLLSAYICVRLRLKWRMLKSAPSIASDTVRAILRIRASSDQRSLWRNIASGLNIYFTQSKKKNPNRSRAWMGCIR